MLSPAPAVFAAPDYRRMFTRIAGVFSLATVLLAPAASAQTFVERLDADDVRVVSYNVLWDTIFPSVNPTQAAKFVRVVNALDADVLCLQEIGYSTPLNNVLTLMDSIMPLPGGAPWNGYKVGDCVTLSRWPLSLKKQNTIPQGDKDLAMALVDLPDALFDHDLYVINNHYKCCGGFDSRRQEQSDSIVNWMRDAREPGGFFNLPAGTAMIVLGDLNIIESFQPAQTLIDGDIQDEAKFGADSAPDWDGSDSTDHRPLQNVAGPADWTWSSPGPFPDGRLDFIISTDSVLTEAYSYSLNTTTMSPADLAASGMQANDVTVDSQGVDFDHVPLVVDYRAPAPTTAFATLGSALAGTFGEPGLLGTGLLVGGDSVGLALSGALPSSTATLVLGLSTINAPFKGGQLVPLPDVLLNGLSVDASGDYELLSTWPMGIAPGFSFWAQYWVLDGGAPNGFAASNAVTATTP
ncbi:MAG: endonuclease/exonuclease/phosphatase family metal-dependent hydrolase [Pseudohongiellaceae bacterium]|jgi:endonuclease/exonuclease/phosphatase family metal-dependent hydrolase